MKTQGIVFAAAALLAVSQLSFAQETAPAADNSANNKADRAGGHATADEQSNSKGDIDLTKRIRQSVMDDEKLSMYGQNVKIVSANGHVTLNGVVRTDGERQQIGMKAAAIAGAGKVKNDLKIAPAN